MKVNLLRPPLPPRPPEIHAFVAVHYDDELLDEVAALAERLRGDPRLSGASWDDPSALRTTLHFFLRTTEARRARLHGLVEELAEMASSAAPWALVRPSRLHGLPTSERAHFLLLDVADVPPATCLAALRARTEVESVAFGSAPSTWAQPLVLRLARASVPVDISGLPDAGILAPGRLTAISLYVSRAGQEGNVQNRYDRVMTAPLRARR